LAAGLVEEIASTKDHTLVERLMPKVVNDKGHERGNVKVTVDGHFGGLPLKEE
jgi:hypothetical protein